MNYSKGRLWGLLVIIKPFKATGDHPLMVTLTSSLYDDDTQECPNEVQYVLKVWPHCLSGFTKALEPAGPICRYIIFKSKYYIIFFFGSIIYGFTTAKSDI